MRITELTGYKNKGYFTVAKNVFDKETPDQYSRSLQFKTLQDFLEKKGFVHLGSGEYGGVYEKSGYPWIFKVFKNDPAYKFYLDYCKKNKDNPNIPKIKWPIIKINNDTFAIRLEKLTPVWDNMYSDLHDKIRYVKAFYKHEFDRDNASQYMLEVEEIVNNFKKKYPGIYDIITTILDSNYRVDVHAENIMMRGDTPVFIDPVSP